MRKTWNPGEFASWLATQTPATRERALDDLSGDQRKRLIEWTTFENFYKAASLGIRPSTVRACDPPVPDIYCELAGKPCYFELGQIVMQEIARNASNAAKVDGVHGGPVSTMKPMIDLFRAKCAKIYETSGYPLGLLLHFNVGHQYPIGIQALSSLLAPCEFDTCQFSMIYIYDGWNLGVLEVISRKVRCGHS
jgi:hypothetical protein